MDETSLRALLDRATQTEPPMGSLVSNSIVAGRRIRRRRVYAAVAAVAAVGIGAAIIPTTLAGHGAIAQRPPETRPAIMQGWPVAFVAAGPLVVPVNTATGVAEAPITINGTEAYNMAIAADGKGFVDGVGGWTIDPVDLVARTAGRPISARSAAGPLAITPNGGTAYVATGGGVLPIRVSDNHVGRLIRTPAYQIDNLVVTPDSRMLYVSGFGTPIAPRSAEILPVQVATNRVLRPVAVAVSGSPLQLLATPDSKTVVVLNEFSEVSGAVVQVNVATNTPMPPVPIRTRGRISDMVLAPDGRAAYVVSANAVTPVDLATNAALPAIALPASAGNAYDVAISPDGTRLYVLTPRGIVPVNSVTREALTPIGIPHLDCPTAIAVNPNGRALYVGAGHTLVSVSTATGKLGSPIALGRPGVGVRPWAFVFRP